MITPAEIALTASKYIQAHYSEIKTVRDISYSLGIPYEKLRKIFPRIMGVSLQEYVHLTRVDRAKTLVLAHTKLYSIAREVGYNDEVEFIRHWKKIMKMTPTEFRIATNGY